MIWLKRGVLAALLLMMGVAVWLWLTMLSPWFYERPAHLAPIEQRNHQVFVYGTLRFAPVRWVVMHANGDPRGDTLEGFRRNGLDLVADSQSTVPGLLLTVTAEELSRLDRYERLGVRYRREAHTLDSGEQAWVYRRLEKAQTTSAAAPKEPALIGYKSSGPNGTLSARLSSAGREETFDTRAATLPTKETL